MQIRPKVSFYHDTRRMLKNGKYPVKVRVTFQVFVNGEDQYDQDYYKTGISLSEKEYSRIFSDSVPASLRSTREKLLQQEKSINDIIDKHPGITPALLYSIYTGKTISNADKSKASSDTLPLTLDVEMLYKYFIQEYEKNEQVGTAANYRDSLSSFLQFGGKGLQLDKIDVAWIEEYEKWMSKPRPDLRVKFGSKDGKKKPASINTIGMYLRTLRRVFNEAIDPKRKLLPMEKYPFGKHGYAIRSQRTVKQVVNEAQKQKVFADQIELAEEKRALQYWMFSYYCHGMNFTDMAHLRPGIDIREDVIVYVRRKTMRTVKEVKPQFVPIRPEVRAILDELGTHKPYAFGIIDDTMDAKTKRKMIKQWYRTTNKYMNQIAKRNGIPFKVNSYGARHAVGKQLIEKGVHLQYIQELYGHTSILTTQIYTSGMDIEKTKTYTDML